MQILAFSFTQTFVYTQSLLNLAFTQNTDFSGCLNAFAFSLGRAVQRELTAFSFMQVNEFAHKFAFSGSQTQGFGDFDIRIFIGNQDVSCALFDTMTIERGENESAICELILLPPRQRKNPQEIDLMQWYSRPISVLAISDKQIVQIYQGFVDKVDYTMLAGQLALRCSERREQKINALPKSEIQSIGYTSTSAHGDTFTNNKAELDTRLGTIPYSFDFDLHGKHRLTAWQPKTTPDYVLSPCVIYQREPTLELSEVGGVVNVVNVELSLSYTRLIQRKIQMNLQSGLEVCAYSKYGKLVSIQDVASAISATGWTLGGFTALRVEQSGWYKCGTTWVGFMRNTRTVNATNTDDPNDNRAGNVKSVTTNVNLDIRSGTFDIYRRWQQQIQQVFKMRLIAPLAERYGETAQDLSFSVQVALPENLTWETANDHEKTLQYEYDKHSIFHNHSANNALPSDYFWRKSQWGDDYADLADSDGEFERTAIVAYHTAYTTILASHRNYLNFQVKFMPFVDLHHTHEIQHSHFSGRVKVAKITHEFDFAKKISSTSLRYGFFVGEGNAYTPFVGIERETPPAQPFQAAYTFGRVELSPDTELDETKHFGMVYRQSKGVLLSLEKLVLRTPEIESASTETQTIEYPHDFNIKTYHDNIQVRL